MIRSTKPLRWAAICGFLIAIFIFFPACGSDSEDSEISELRFKGKWNGNLGFVDLDISMIVREVSANTFQGDFYVSDNFTSCCNSGTSDGSISYRVENSEIVDFTWNDIIPQCTGSFNGSGNILSGGDLRIDLTGTDCDGDHVAVLTFSLQ